MGKLSAEQETLESELSNPDLYALGKMDIISAHNSRLEIVRRELAAAEAAWLAAEAALEQLAS
jgi:hypothetical protein